MDTVLWIAAGLTTWSAGASVVGLVIASAVRLRDLPETMHADDSAAALPELRHLHGDDSAAALPELRHLHAV
jgi:hypothetical protein